MQVAAAATTATVQQCRRLGEGGKVLCKPHQKWWLADPAKFRVNVMLASKQTRGVGGFAANVRCFIAALLACQA